MNSGVEAEASSLRQGVVESVMRRRADAWWLQSEGADSAAVNESSQVVASSVGFFAVDAGCSRRCSCRHRVVFAVCGTAR